MGVHRSTIMRQDRMDFEKANAKNRINKDSERIRRDARMIAKLQAGSLPYTPVVMSWLSRKLNKKSSGITLEDVKTILA